MSVRKNLIDPSDTIASTMEQLVLLPRIATMTRHIANLRAFGSPDWVDERGEGFLLVKLCAKFAVSEV